jgi:ATP-dependent helicase HepA
LQVSVFHEQMTIIERDRVAAWFADADDGPRILICSEIGSEGRNFQFLHNIVLFELPDNPDLLEQRIGRLDRIGQRHTINIHVPVAANTNGARLSHWYHHALNAFEKSCVTGQFIKTERSEEFAAYLIGEHTDEGGFIADCKQLHGDKMDELNRGRNRLLELNACRIEVAEPIIKRIHEGEKNESLSAYLEKAFDCFGVEFEDHSLNSWIVRPGDHLQVEQFPELPEDGITITTNRETALAREDMHFMTWEHPMVRATFDLVLNGEKGSVSLCALTMPQFPPRSILMEALFESNCPAPAWLGVDRYLRRNALRLLVDQRGNDHAQHLAADEYAALLDNIDPEVALQMIDRTSTTLKQQVQMVEETASQQLGQLRTSSIAAMHSALDSELGRLLTLKKRNPTIRDEEIRQLQTTIAELEKCLKSSSLKLSALRVIYTH